MTPDITTRVREAFDKEFRAYERLRALAQAWWGEHGGALTIDVTRSAARVVTALYAKAVKTYQAIHLLASQGYGEDAMVLARTLANLCIDLAYICREETDVRAERWLASGECQLRRFLRGLKKRHPDEDGLDWPQLERLAAEWEKVNIRHRAEDAGLLGFYDTAYRHGSSFEHSDSWSAAHYLDVGETHITLKTARSADFMVSHALFAGAFAFLKVVETRARFHGISEPDFTKRLEDTYSSGFINIPSAVSTLDNSASAGGQQTGPA